MKRVLSVLLAVLLVLAMTACGTQNEDPQSGTNDDVQSTGDAQYTVGIIQLSEHSALDSAREGFIVALADNGLVDGENLEIDFQNAQNDQSNLGTIADRFVSKDVDLVLAIATPAAQTMAGKTTEIPIIATAVTDFAEARLVNDNDNPGTNVSGTSDMNPIKEQIELVKQLAPDCQTVGVCYNSGEDNSVLQAELARAEIEAQGMSYVEVTVSSTNDVQQAITTLASQCDAIYLPTDNTLASSIPVVYGVVAETKTPVIGGESGMVDSGALATVGINYYDLGYQAGEMAIRVLLEGADISTMPVEHQTEYEYTFNLDTAEAIGLTIPEDLLALAGE